MEAVQSERPLANTHQSLLFHGMYSWRILETSEMFEFTYSVHPLIAQDLLSAPASQAFTERLFSVCGILASGKNLQMRA